MGLSLVTYIQKYTTRPILNASGRPRGKKEGHSVDKVLYSIWVGVFPEGFGEKLGLRIGARFLERGSA